MELVYLWVEDYKNIHKQGFNFSPRFRCEYDGKTLTIDENDDYIPDFFGKNINVTAIVGKNGSGKSSVVEILLNILFDAKNSSNIDDSWMILYDSNKKTVLCKSLSVSHEKEFLNIIINNSYISKSICSYDNKKYFNNNYDYKINNLLYNPSVEMFSASFLNNIHKSLKDSNGSIYELDAKPDELNIFAFPSKKNHMIDIKKNENIALLNMFKTDKNIRDAINQQLKTDNLDFLPVKMKVTLDRDLLLLKLNSNNHIKLFWKKDGCMDLSIDCLFKIFITLIISYSDTKKDEFNQYFIANKNIKIYLQNNFQKIIREKDIEDEDKLSFNLKQIFFENTLKMLILQEGGFVSILKKDKLLDESVRVIARLIDNMNKNNIYKDILNKEITDKNIIESLLPLFPNFFNIDTLDKKDRSFSDFSNGEKQIVLFIHSSLYYLNFFHKSNYSEKKYNDVVLNFFVDELEMGLHPNWQKKVINIFTNIIKNTKINVNIIFITHSPFVLSDLPKQNVIFLDTYKKEEIEVKEGKQDIGNCRVIPHDEVLSKKQTFGANIHTLLSDSFFMDDGLMGEFAKNKIQEIMDFLNDKTKIEKISTKEGQIKQVIESIGEPFLKRRLLDMYYIKYQDESLKEVRKKELEADKERIEEELKRYD